MPDLDLLIRNGQVIDGSGRPAFRADVGVSADRVAVVGDLTGAAARRVLDASGRFVTPGFMDIHTHSDESAVVNRRMESKIQQGVTVEVAGNCGASAAPLVGDSIETETKDLALYGYSLDWRTMDEYLSRVEAGGISNNLAMLVGHGTLRQGVMSGAMRAPSATEMDEMSRMLDDSLKAGAWGMSTGLIYPPSSYAETGELIALARVCKPHGGIYASHIRNEGEQLLDAVSEAIRIGEEAGVPVEIAHHKASGKANWGKVKESLPLIAAARERGVQITCDQYPYVASSTGLSVIIPDWAHEGGNDRLLERLRNTEAREHIRHDIRIKYPGWDDPSIDSSWHRIVVASARGHAQFEGLTTWQMAEAWHTDPLEASLDLIIAEEANVASVMFGISEDDVQLVMRAPFIMVGSDAAAKSPTGPMSEGKPHPRAYGTFPRVLGHYVRELGVITWEEAIRKMTSLPAAKLGLPGRGVLAAGAFADVVVFDPDTVADRATFTEPHQFPVGLDYVIVNGVVTVDHGEHTGALAGRVLRRGRSR